MNDASRVLVIGSANVDFIMNVPALPRPGETVLGGTFALAHGGKGANTAVAAVRSASAGTQVAFAARLGNDALAGPMREAFTEDGLDISAVRNVEAATGTAIILIDANGENSIAVASGANALFDAKEVDELEPAIAAAGMVLLQMEVPAAVNRRVLEIARRVGTRVLLNYAPAEDKSVPITPALSVLVVNEHEAAALTGVDDIRQAAERLRQQGPTLVVVTLGSKGVHVLDEAGPRDFAARKVAVKDTTAAGDTFCGALGTALAEGRPVDEAVAFAQIAAALCCTRSGAQPSIPRRAEVLDWI